MKTRVLFLSEAVTWSQVVRLVVLARGLDRARFDVHFAASRFDPRLFGDATFPRSVIHSLTPEAVDRRIARGGRIYDLSTLSRYVDEELKLFRAVRPDIVVSDLRWSTTVSAPLTGVRLVTLIDAYWFRPLDRYPIPDHPVVRLLGVERVTKGFASGLPFALRHFATPVNELRRKHGLAPFTDLRDVLGFGDRLLFPDDPTLVPSERAGVYLGPIAWSPDAALPPWWDSVGQKRELVYVTLGSSGAIEVVPRVLEAVATLDVDVVLSTAGRFLPRNLPANVRVVDSIRGDLAAARASVVVCSGGASTGWQALAAGKPVVGIPANLDAALAMSCIEEAGAGIALRPTATVATIRAAIQRASTSVDLYERAQEISRSFARFDAHARFAATLDELVAETERDTRARA